MSPLDRMLQLVKDLRQQGMNITTLEEGYLTVEGLVRAMSIEENWPRFIGRSKDEFGCLIAALENRGYMPVITKMIDGAAHYVIAICAHDLTIDERPLRNADEIIFNLEDLLRLMDFPYIRDDKHMSYVLIPSSNDGDSDYYEDLRKAGVVFSQRQRQLFLEGINEDSTAVQSVYAVIRYAIAHGVSDIHIEPDPNLEMSRSEFLEIHHSPAEELDAAIDAESGLKKEVKPDNVKRGGRVRYRKDGIMIIGNHFLTAANIVKMIAVIKNLANMKMDEHHRDQDGRFSFGPEDIALYPKLADYDFRVSVAVTIHGENAVLRLLRKKSRIFMLKDCSLPSHLQGILERKIREPKGVILVSGPTGSGKTTTLYAALAEINDGTRNITAIEDPTEVQTPGIRQVMVNLKTGQTFAACLRTSMRQDPDVIFIGEIRDEETAQIAIRASMTGHLLVSTIHINSSLEAIMRLVNLGIPGDYVASNLLLVLSQRLVRKICPHCREKYNGRDDLKRLLGKDIAHSADSSGVHYVFDEDINLWHSVRGKTCSLCLGTGYCDRQLLAEGFLPTAEIKDMISRGEISPHKLYAEAIKTGFESMSYMAVRAVVNGITDIPEILRAAATEDEFLRDGPHIIAPALRGYLRKHPQAKS